MLHKLGWQSLDGRRQDQGLVFFFKIINGLALVETEDILTPADSRTRKNHSFKFKHLQANCDSYRYSFFPATISSWNNLPFGIEKVDSVEGFKLVQKSTAYTWLDRCCFNAAQIVLTPPAPRNGGPFLPFFGQAGQVDPLVGWRSCY